MQAIEGKSLTDIFNSELDGIVNPSRNFVLVGKEKHDVGRPGDVGYPVRGIIKDGFLYLRNFKTERWPAGNPETGYLNTDGSPTKTVILNDRRSKGNSEYWQLNFGRRIEEELYNIEEDPFCFNNLALNQSYSEIMVSVETGYGHQTSKHSMIQEWLGMEMYSIVICIPMMLTGISMKGSCPVRRSRRDGSMKAILKRK